MWQKHLRHKGFRRSNSMAHDLRNLLATVALHLETLQRLSGPSGAKAADAAHALLTRGATMCNAVLDRSTSADGRARRKGVDPIQVARQIADLLAPTVPKDFSFDIEQSTAACVLADPDDLFRVLFNLMSNAVAVANREPGSLKTVKVRVGAGESMVVDTGRRRRPGAAGWSAGGIVRPPCAADGATAAWLRSCDRARACGAKWRDSHARSGGQRHHIRVEAAGAPLGPGAGRAAPPGPAGDGLVMRESAVTPANHHGLLGRSFRCLRFTPLCNGTIHPSLRSRLCEQTDTAALSARSKRWPRAVNHFLLSRRRAERA